MDSLRTGRAMPGKSILDECSNGGDQQRRCVSPSTVSRVWGMIAASSSIKINAVAHFMAGTVLVGPTLGAEQGLCPRRSSQPTGVTDV